MSRKPKPPFEPTPAKRRQYVLERLAGEPVSPSPVFSQGDNEADLLASWINDRHVPWWSGILEDVRDLLTERLGRLGTGPLSPEERAVLAGLLTVTIKTHEPDCAARVAQALTLDAAGCLPKWVAQIENLETWYGRLGYLMCKVLSSCQVTGGGGIVRAMTDQLSRLEDAYSALISLAYEPDTRLLASASAALLKRCWDQDDVRRRDQVLALLAEAGGVNDRELPLRVAVEDFAKPTIPMKLRCFLADGIAHLTGCGHLEAINRLKFPLPSPHSRPQPLAFLGRAALWTGGKSVMDYDSAVAA